MSVSHNTPSPVQQSTPSPHQLSRPEFERFIQGVNNSIEAEALVKDLLGNLNKTMSNRDQLRFGTKGSLCVTLNGPREGTWMNYESGKGGDLIQLIQQEKRLNFKSALSYVTPYVGSREIVQQIDDFTHGKKSQEIATTERSLDLDMRLKKEVKEKAFAKESHQKIESAKEIISKTIPLEGTPAESYLKNERCIKGQLPDSLRYLPAGTQFHYGGKDRSSRKGALAAIAIDSLGLQKAVQITYLTQEGKRAETPDGEKFPKISYGVVKGAGVLLHGGDGKERSQPITIAEGVETALSLKEAGIKGSVLCSLGSFNIKSLNLQNRDVLLAGDWDGSFETPSWHALEKAKTFLEEKNNKVEVILPVKNPEQNPEFTNVTVDFNDLLKQGGIQSVRDRLSDRLLEGVGKASPLRDIAFKDSYETQENLHPSKSNVSFAGSDAVTHTPQTTGPILEKMAPKMMPDKGAQSQLTSSKLSLFKTNPFDVKSLENDLGRGR